MSVSIQAFSGKLREKFQIPEEVFSILIDHHETSTHFATLNYVDSSKPSLCALLVDFFKTFNVKFDSELSRRLLLGVCTDCGFFRFSNSAESLPYAAFLVEQGADYIKDIVRPVLTNPLRIKKFFAELINNIKLDEKLRVCYSSLSYEKVKEFGLNRAEVRLGINEMQDIAEIDVYFNLIELEDHIKGSFRSQVFDISLLAQELGGGGHKSAAGFILPKIPLEEAEKKVLDVIRSKGFQKQ